MSDLVRELEALDAKATKGPWWIPEPDAFPWFREGCGERGENTMTILGSGGYGVFSAPWSITDNTSTNWELMCALRNALPALIEYVRAQDAVWEACEGVPIFAAQRLEAAEAALLAALEGRHE